MTSRRVAVAIALLVLVARSAPAEQDPRAALDETASRVLSILAREDFTTEQRIQHIEQIAEERFDFEVLARLVLARNYRKLSPEQRVEFVREFRQHLARTYGRRLERYAGEQIEVGEARTEANGDATVRTTMVGGNQDGARVDYRLRLRNGSWYVIDVIVEGVSLVQNFRTQIQEIVSSKGVDHLIQTLREKNTASAGN